jgi:uncharacterized SAM-binding protein YcdF (DUF218 family)
VYVYLSKLLPLLVMPLGIALLCLLVSLVLLQRKKRKAAASFLGAGILVLWLAATPLVANGLYAGLEGRYPPPAMEDIPGSGCLVVLGGAVGPALSPRRDTELHEAVDRVYKAAELYRAGKARLVIVSAGNQPWSEAPLSEASMIQRLLIEWGVPEESIVLEGSSRNTRENAVFSRNIIQSTSCGRPLLVTSAAHMPLVPSANALAMTSEAIREWIGRLYYVMRGWS